MAILSIKNLVKRFGGITAVNNCSFDVTENSITALIGPNGAGKTTMFDLITGLLEHDGGEIFFKGKNIGQLLPYNRARLGLARTFQLIRIFPELTLLENILLAYKDYRDTLHSIFTPSRVHNLFKEKAHEALRLINLQDKTHVKAHELSYGQQKLLEIMRAVATDADLLLFDEPAAGINRTILHTVISLIKKLKRDGKTIIIVEHDMGFVMELCERIVVMDYGKEIAEGNPEEIQNNPKVLEAYLGLRVPGRG